MTANVRFGARAVHTAWTVKDSKGQVLPRFNASSRLEVARKVARGHYDAFRLQVSSSYREIFNRDVDSTLRRKQWQIVPLAEGRTARRRSRQLTCKLN